LFIIIIISHFGGPESEVVSDELHDGSGVLITVFLNTFDISNGIIKSGLSDLTSHSLVTHDFIVEDREVQGKA
jgi:hypothetical protein